MVRSPWPSRVGARAHQWAIYNGFRLIEDAPIAIQRLAWSAYGCTRSTLLIVGDVDNQIAITTMLVSSGASTVNASPAVFSLGLPALGKSQTIGK